MIAGLEVIATNTGFGVDDLILIIVAVGGIIFYAVDFKKGLLLHNFAFVLITMLFYGVRTGLGWDWDWTKPLYAFLITLIIMAFVLYGAKNQTGGGFV